MPNTITLRRSVALGLLLLVVGGGVYGYAAHQEALRANEAGIAVEPVETTEPATNASALPRDQRALFLLAVTPGETNYFVTPDDRLQAAADDIPERVGYEGVTYDVQRTHSDSLGGALSSLVGIVVTGLGALTLLGAGLGSAARRVRS
ncbi:MAG: hypothetical protein ABEJ68_09955 [Halobacteriaceae archaeon]